MSEAYDVIVVGARCAGSPLAMLLARRGLRVLLLDKASFPSDTLSGHNAQFAATAALARWGLYDRVVATGCAPITHYFGDYEDFSLYAAPPPARPVDPPAAVCVRRTVLDHILTEAAVSAGVVFREGCAVTDVVRDGDRVAGVRTKGGEVANAAMVVGADGMRSSIARMVDAGFQRRVEPMTCVYYSYYEGLAARPGKSDDAVEAEGWWGRRRDEGFGPAEGMLVIALPTNTGAKAVMVVRPISEFAEFKKDLERNFSASVLRTPFAERFSAARRVERIYGTSDTPNFFRRAVGPGWALVGDASFFKDPIVGHGIADAFVWTEILAEQIHGGLERGDVDAALQAYATRRDREGLASYNMAIAAAKLQPLTRASRPLLEALSRNEREAGRYFGAVMAQSVDPMQFFAARNVQRIVAESPPG